MSITHQYKNHIIEMNEFYNSKHPETRFVFYSESDCDKPINWASTIEKCKEIIDSEILGIVDPQTAGC